MESPHDPSCACTYTHTHARTHVHAHARTCTHLQGNWTISALCGLGLAPLRGRGGSKGGSKVPGSGSREGFTTARPVPKVEVPKAFNVKEFQPRQFAPMGLSQRGMLSEKGSLSLIFSFFLTTKGVSTKPESKSIKNGECALQGRSSSDATSNGEQRSHLQSCTVH